jgi:hypothetical protein
MADLDRQRAVDRAALVAAFREGSARKAEQRERDLARVVDSIITRTERSPEETAARLADLERRAAALDVDPGVVDLDALGGGAT